MKKIYLLFVIMMVAVVSLFAQAPEKFSFQAVVRNGSNQLIINAQVGVRVSILQGSTTGDALYVETHTATTNANGLLTVEVGGGTVQQGIFANLDWADGPWFLKTETDPDGGNNYSVVSVQQLLSVPYALYAKEAGNGFSGEITDYLNATTMPAVMSALTQAGVATQSDIPTVPTNVSAFTNDAGYLTGYTETDPQFNAWDKSYNDLTDKPVLFSGDYNDLTNKPTIPTVPTNVSAFTNDAGYLTSYTEQQVLSISNDTLFLTGGSFVKLPAGFDGNYNSLTNKPEIPTVPTNVSAFTNDAGYITGYTETDPQFNAWDKSYNDLTDKPEIPTVPTNVSDFTNDAGYITGYTETDPQFNAWDKSYNDLTDKPEIPTVPTNVSAFTNDAGYLTGYTETDPQFNAWDKSYNDLTDKPVLFSGDYNDLTNKPTIPTVPTNVSTFTNDAGYITSAALPTVPTNVGAFTNDAHYVNNTGCDSIQFCDIIARLNAMQAEIDALRAMMPADTTQTGTDTTVTPDPVNPIDTVLPFTCPDLPKVTDFDGNEYNTVQVGNQCWLRENIRSTHYANGVAIPLIESLEGLAALPEGYLYPNLDQANVSKYGYLYTYTAASFRNSINVSSVGPIPGVCPAGWRMPTNDDWNTLFNYLSQWDTLRCNNETAQVVKAICSREDWAPSTTECAIGWNTESNNATGFSIKPAGYVENGPYGVYGQNVGPVPGNAAYFFGDGITKTFSTSGATVTSETIGQMPMLSNASKRAASVRCVKHVHTMSTSNLLPGVVTTDSVAKSIYSTTVICGGNVLDLGSVPGSNSHGICYSTSPNPTTSSSVAGAGSGMGAFNVKLTGLTPSTTYYFRAYVTNARGTTYGAEWTFTTREDGYEPEPTLPVVNTVSVTGVTAASALFNGSVTDDGYADVTARGFCWGLYPNPTLDSTYSVDGSGLGTFSHSIAQLHDATTYYVRAYATNSVGTVYGEQLTFTTDTLTNLSCGQMRVEDPDGNFYSTVLIGNQCWMKENLRTTHYADGEEIPFSSATYVEAAHYFYPGGNANNVEAYGLLYNWNAAMHGENYTNNSAPTGVQGICPDGWHLPSYAEINTLISYVRATPEYLCNNATTNISKAMADSLYWLSSTAVCTPGYDPSSNNATGFSARPAAISSAANRLGRDAYFYTSSASIVSSGGQQIIRPWMCRIYTQSSSTGANFVLSTQPPVAAQMHVGASIRCVKNEE
ncbi:MAG: fibrobacter succinogenes major paralogous domain-containing protein [Bacteroidales bacterium]|nr:fibrobacter succinogenes major paralogous domain-containing protein [Bacteroidales bacterium]